MSRVHRSFAQIAAVLAFGGTAVLISGCGGGGGAIVSTGGGGSTALTSIRFNDPSKAPSANLLFDGGKWTTKAGATVTAIGEGDINQQSKQAGQTCMTCHAGVHSEYRAERQVANATGLDTAGMPDSHNAHGENFLDGSGGMRAKLTMASCVPCHTNGAQEEGGYDEGQPATAAANLPYLGIQCENCHGPGGAHAAAGGDKSLINGVPDAKQTCWSCHVPKSQKWLWETQGLIAATTDAALEATKPGSVAVHHPQAAMLNGVYGYEYPGKTYQFSARGHVNIKNSCITCHLTQGLSAATGKADHSRTSLQVDTAVCASCHPNPNTLIADAEEEMVAMLIELGGEDGANPGHPDQTVSGGLLGEIAAANPALAADIKDGTNNSKDDKATKAYKAASHNFMFIEEGDKSSGIHNFAYAEQLLKDSIGDLNAILHPAT